MSALRNTVASRKMFAILLYRDPVYVRSTDKKKIGVFKTPKKFLCREVLDIYKSGDRVSDLNDFNKSADVDVETE